MLGEAAATMPSITEKHALSARDRLIVALDFNSADKALALVDQLGDEVVFYKVGYELFVSSGWAVIEELARRGFRVFLDLKMDDVEATVESAVRQIATREYVQFLTIHGNGATAEAARRGKGDSDLNILQITLLTSLDHNDLRDLMLVGDDPNRYKFSTVEQYVEWRAEQSLKHGCDGLISSGQNAKLLRDRYGHDFILVCPGIRMGHDGKDDHKRSSTPYDAIYNGADYIVVGRPIRAAKEPALAAERIVAEIDRALQSRR